MRTRDVSKLMCGLALAVAVAVVAASCGTGNGDSFFSADDGGDDGLASNDGTTLTGDGSSITGDGGGHCKPNACADLGYTCGDNGDGCGGLLQCGTCVAPQYCGGGGFSKCGGTNGVGPDGGVLCTPATCKSLGYTCGAAGDGCGGVLQCGSCMNPQYCGGGGYDQCGGNNGIGPDGGVICMPTTCAKQGINCGPTGDGCGGLIQSCGMCMGNDYCGGGGPGVCGNSKPCVNLCQKQVACDAGVQTTITGRVVAGTIAQYGTPDPVPNVLVYVPNAPLQAFTPGVACGCPQASGDPLVSTTTAIDGTFTLTNVPVGNAIPVVIQLGRWRREVSFDVLTPCASSAVGDIHMPRTKFDGNNNQADIPFTALSTGNVDTMECVLLKMGVDQSEFTNPAGTGRINLYMGNGSDVTGGAPPESQLTSTLATLEEYDQTLFPCWGMPVDKNAADLSNVVTYTNAGGRMFATHYSYTWLYTTTPFDQTANWTNPDQQAFNQLNGVIDTTFPRGKTFGDWMTLIGAASGNPPVFSITSPRHDFDAPVAPSLRYVYSQNNGQFPLHYTFDMPWQQQNVCGRVIYSDFHVADTTGGGQTFPNECTGGPMNAQEKALEYMIWDLAACLGPQMPMCTPLTCAQQKIACGPAGDGCGGLIQSCGTCQNNQTCGGGGMNGQCGYPDGGVCEPETCAQQNITCGPAGDGCGGLIQSCGTCQNNQTCGGGGKNGQCGSPDGGTCTPRTCAQQGINCGPAGDGCGNLLDCGTCSGSQTCGGGGQPGVCGGGTQ
jgi:hypothetical protein